VEPTGGTALVAAPPDATLSLPPGRGLAALSAAECHELLAAHGVLFAVLDARDAPGVPAPVRVGSPLGGVDVVPAFAPRSSVHAIMDCRLALAVVAWAPELRARGVIRVEHYSAFRPGSRVAGSGAPSGHASALALDVARLVREDGLLADVLEHWGDRTRGDDPCAPRDAEDEAASLLRGAVCAAVAADLFQVVITPHHDARHQNHVHLELRPDVDWSYVR
jgi:hypothetical protein